jgi:prepilin-type processing-associated H-X9-DG protein
MEPANTLCIADTTTDDFVTGRTCVIEQYANTNAAFRRWMGDLHLNGSNIIFCDGHAKRFSVQRDANNITVHPQKADGVCWYANASQ